MITEKNPKLEFLLNDQNSKIALELLSPEFSSVFLSELERRFWAHLEDSARDSQFSFKVMVAEKHEPYLGGWLYPLSGHPQPSPLCPWLGFWYRKEADGVDCCLFMDLRWTAGRRDFGFNEGETVQGYVSRRLTGGVEVVKDLATLIRSSGGNTSNPNAFGGIPFNSDKCSRTEYLRRNWATDAARSACAKRFIIQCVSWFKDMEAPLQRLNQVLNVQQASNPV